LTRVF